MSRIDAPRQPRPGQAPRRRPVALRIAALVAAAVIVGPPLAAVVFLIVTGLMRFGLPVLDQIGPTFALAITPYSWLIAIVPAFVTGAVNGAAVLLLPKPGPRLLLAPLVGAIAFAVFLNWLVEDGFEGASSGSLMAALALSGALASLVCVALVESFGRGPDAG